jgi:hypothetical protein
MRNADAGLEQRGVGPQDCDAAARPLAKGNAGRMARVVGSTPFRPSGARGASDQIMKSDQFSPRRTSERSFATARNVWANESIRQKIIGHRMAVGRHGFGNGLFPRGLDVGGAHIAIAQLEEHASNHSVGIFVEQLVDKGIDFLAEIGGVAETRELVTVQGVAGSGKEEFPRRLSAANVHGALRRKQLARDERNRITASMVLTSKYQVTGLWKTVETEENSARACSGCAGDYEDPDRSAWEEEIEGEEVDVQREAGDEPGPDE